MTRDKMTLRERWRTLVRALIIITMIVVEGCLYLFRREPLSEHLYRLVVRLGPTFIKLGQVASTRPDLVPPAISHRFTELQENVPGFPFQDARQLVETELGQSLEEAYAVFPAEPVASASLSQVYFAKLPDGTPVAVKVQRPGIHALITRDLAILRWLAQAAERFNRVARELRLASAVNEFGRWTLRELDFELEGHNAETFRRNFKEWDDVIFPRVYWGHTMSRVLTMQRISGLRVGEVPQTIGPVRSRKLARRLAELEMKMFITDAFFHADLHPGNIFFQPDGRIAVLDLGMIGRLTSQQRDRFLAYWIAITRRQRDRAFYHLLQMAESTEGADLEGFRSRYEVTLDRFYDADLSERSLAQTYLEIVLDGARFGVEFPSEMILQAKAIVTAEALDLVLAPDFRFADEVRPIIAHELARRAAPGRLIDRLWGSLAEWVLLGEAVPGDMPQADNAHEAAFRRQAIAALADAWVDHTDTWLRARQRETPPYTTSGYWAERPALQALLEALLGFLSLAATQLDRVQEVAQRNAPQAADDFRAPWQVALAEKKLRDNGRLTGDELGRTFDYLQTQVRSFPVAGYWQDRAEDKAALHAGLTQLRLLVTYMGQALHASDETPPFSSEKEQSDAIRAYVMPLGRS